MTRTSSPGGFPGERNALYYRRRAEGTVVNQPASRNHPDIPLFQGEPALATLE